MSPPRYQRVHDEDELVDDDGDDMVQHPPFSILVHAQEHVSDDAFVLSALKAPPLSSSVASSPSSGSGGGNSSGNGMTMQRPMQDSLKHLPWVTKDYFQNKWLPTKAPRATLANVPPLIVSDLQHGHLPPKTDPALRDLASRGWTIVHRRVYKQNKRRRSSDRQFQPSNQLSASVFVKTDYASLTFYPNALEFAFDQVDAIPVPKEQYDVIVDSVRAAINDHIQPSRISQGSSGSYFCRNQQGQIVGVFKPKDEEPYGQLNPKWTKWIHRHLFPCCFGRTCLIPNLGYLSEAAASLVDQHLGTNIVPTTHVDTFASPAFHYRRKKDPLRQKIGSFQCFLNGFRDANVFLRDHPWPANIATSSAASWVSCFPYDDDHNETAAVDSDSTLASPTPSSFQWTPALQFQFRLQIERLVLLDYLIRNTDRGPDNWMVKFCTDCGGNKRSAHIHVAAIDHGLAFPFKHPDEWRSYPYGWLGLPHDLIGQPFAKQTRKHFLPLLSDPLWWQRLIRKLERLFRHDSDFNRTMFQRQMAVLRGQGYNLVRVLKDDDAGPLDLVAMQRCLIQDEEVFVEYDDHLLQTRSSKATMGSEGSNGSDDAATTASTAALLSPHTPRPSAAIMSARATRLKPKRSTSFHIAVDLPQRRAANDDNEMHDDDDDDDEEHDRAISPSSKPRLSLDIERPASRDDTHAIPHDTDDDQHHRVRLVMERVKVVKSKVPYFTCC
ncbi:phosphatidylinositol 3 and 4-kinase-domain-containing protein [Gongronella butleri]|nr:phosphatidylinositol 3 and 4-kinase-domain-containing protein [Gongronella butleri]